MTARVVALGPWSRQGGLLSTSGVGDVNRAVVLQAIADHGPAARADLARLVGVTRGSIGGIVAGLLEEGTLRELQPDGGPRRVGQPSRPLSFGDRGTVGAVVVKSACIEVGLVSMSGVIAGRQQEVSAGFASTGQFEEAVTRLTDDVFGSGSDLMSVGLTIPAVFDQAGEILAATTAPALVGADIAATLASRFDVPVVVEDDARALAGGQRWFGEARGVPEFAALQIGEGIGAGIMLGGRLYRGPTTATEVGHTTVDLNGAVCTCGLIGCWETVASLRWLRARAGELTGDAATPAHLAALAAGGDPSASIVLHEYADNVAVGIVNLFHTLSIPNFILHGEVTRAGDHFLETLIERARARTLPALGSAPVITFARDESEAGLLGAAAMALTYALGVHL